MKPIYLDNNATTALDNQVVEVIKNALNTGYGNPSSVHDFGKTAKMQLQKARDTIASYLKCTSREIIFTSGATEALNLVIRGLTHNLKGHVISSDVEHPAVYSTLKQLESETLKVSYLNPGKFGAITLDAVKQAFTKETKLIVLMMANNETGVRTDIEAISAFAKENNVFFVVDGVAFLGKEKLHIPEGVSAICFSGHKIHAPKGIGFAFIRKNVKLAPFITGGDQEFGRRGGTENMLGILGLAEAISVLAKNEAESIQKMRFLRDRFEKKILENLSFVFVNGEGLRVSNTSNLCFLGHDGEFLMTALDRKGVMVSLGSACASGAIEPSRVLLNMGLSMKEAASSIRFSLSRFTTEKEIDDAADLIIKLIKSHS